LIEGTVSETQRSSFTDFVSVAPELFFGSHPEGEDPFELGPTVVVCLSSRPSSSSEASEVATPSAPSSAQAAPENYPRATVEDFIEWLRQDFAEIAVVPYGL
jgi:hypothetical protein